MDILPTQLIGTVTWAGVGALFVWVILRPLTALLIAKVNKTDTSADARLCKLENDFTHEVRADIAEMKGTIEYLRQEYEVLKTKVAVLESRVK